MKGVNPHRMRLKYLTLPLVALLFTIGFLLFGEKNPFLTTILSAQDQAMTSFSGIISDSPNDQLMAMFPKEHNVDASSFASEEAEQEKETTSSEHNVDASSFANEEAEQAKETTSSDTGLLNFTVVQSPQRNDNDLVMMTSSFEKEDCNFAKGRWVEDSRRPLYSGFGCKQWLSEMWACRLTQRTDFSYEKYKWQPLNCHMPEFEGTLFLQRMRDKTLAFVGDSLGRQQFQSLMCMITGGKEHPKVKDVGREYGLLKARRAIRPDGWAYRFPETNTTILYYWSASLCGIEPIDITNPATNFAMHLDRPPAFLNRFLYRFDVLVLNTGHHWNRGKITGNRWVMHANGKPVHDRKLLQIGNAKNFAIHSVVKWVDSQLPFHPRLKVFFRTLSPRHFFHGDWNTGGSCDSIVPLARGREVLKDESNDAAVEDAVKGTKVKILDISAISELRDEGHISRYSIKATEGVQDCLHWCLPGIPDTWNELLFAQI